MQPYKNCNRENTPSVTSQEGKTKSIELVCVYISHAVAIFFVLLLVIFMSRYSFIAFVFVAEHRPFETICDAVPSFVFFHEHKMVSANIHLFFLFVFIIAFYFAGEKNQFVPDC